MPARLLRLHQTAAVSGALLLTALAGIAGCGSSSHAAASAPAGGTNTDAGVPAASALSTATPASSPTTSPPAAVVSPVPAPSLPPGAATLPPAPAPASNRCRAAQLSVATTGQQGATGGSYANFKFTNTSGGVCTLQGYVGVQLLDASSQPMPTSLARETGPIALIVLQPGQSAYFFVHYPNPLAQDPPCQAQPAPRLAVTPPDDTASLPVAAPDDGIQACGGKISTGPVQTAPL